MLTATWVSPRAVASGSWCEKLQTETGLDDEVEQKQGVQVENKQDDTKRAEAGLRVC